MFENLRDAFHEAIANFKEELDRDEVPGTVDRLFLGMKNELADANNLLAGLEKEIEQARVQVKHDTVEEATCRRRGEMARQVGDEETAHLAFEYAARYERRRVVLERKVVALDEERVLRAVELREMTERLAEAREKRDALAAAAGASNAAETIRAADDLVEELDRMADEMDAAGPADQQSRRMDDLEREFRNLHIDQWGPIPGREMDPDAALDELKRRMGRE